MTALQKRITYLDLFAGAGGLSEGFASAGFQPIAHIEMDRDACSSLKTRESFYYLNSIGMLGNQGCINFIRLGFADVGFPQGSHHLHS